MPTRTSTSELPDEDFAKVMREARALKGGCEICGRGTPQFCEKCRTWLCDECAGEDEHSTLHKTIDAVIP